MYQNFDTVGIRTGIRAGIRTGILITSTYSQIQFKEIFPLIQYLICLESSSKRSNTARTRFETFECNGVILNKWVYHMPPSGFVIRETYPLHPYDHKNAGQKIARHVY